MFNRALLTLLFALWATGCLAQSYIDRNDTVVQPFASIPYPAYPVAGAQYGVTPTTVTALTVPAAAQFMRACASTAIVRYTTSGTAPTGSVGLQIAVGSCIELTGRAVLMSFQAFSSSGVLDVEYFK